MENNHAGESHFVDYRLVRGTLKRGFEVYTSLRHPFVRALFMLFMVSEVHPFNDGNGRISRMMMNAELSAADTARIIVPTVFREDYLLALRKLSRNNRPDTYVNVMERLQLFSASIPCSDFEAAKSFLQDTNAFSDAESAHLKFHL